MSYFTVYLRDGFISLVAIGPITMGDFIDRGTPAGGSCGPPDHRTADHFGRGMKQDKHGGFFWRRK